MKTWQKYAAVSLFFALAAVFISNRSEFKCDCDLAHNISTASENGTYEQEEEEEEEEEHPLDFTNVMPPIKEIQVRPKFWFHVFDDKRYHIFETVHTVLDHLDLDEIAFDFGPNGNFHYQWDLLWSYQYHDLLELPVDWSRMAYYQKMNHIPGNHVLCSKSYFGSTTLSRYVPRAFTDVRRLKVYAEAHPEKLFVTKLRSNRGVQLKTVAEMNFNENDDLMSGYFAQEFIANPLLFDGHKFDFGIYVLVTSVDPLRIYYYTKNMIFRFCPKTYNISDPSDTDRYVVSDSKIPVWKFHGTRDYFEHGYNTRDAFDGFLKRVGADVDDIWFQIEDCIRSLIVSKEKIFVEWIKKLGTTKLNHFELFRFDMILDSNFKLHVIEINQHPNLYPSVHFARNKVLYENLLYNLFTLIGVGTNFRKVSMRLPSMDIEKMIAHPHSMTVRPEACLTSFCQRSCESVCNLCWRCLDSNRRYELLQAYREQTNAGDFQRIFPPQKSHMEHVEGLYGHQLTNNTKLHVEWYREMCKKNRHFC